MTTIGDVFRKEQTRDADGQFASGGGGPEKRTVSTKPKKAPHEVYAAKVKARLADPKPLSFAESTKMNSDLHHTGKHGKALGPEAAGELRDAIYAHKLQHKAPEHDWKADAERKARYGSKSLAEQQQTKKRGERPMTITDLFAKSGPMTVSEFFEKRAPTTIGDVFGVTRAFDDVFQKAAKDAPEPEPEPTIPGSFEHFIAKARAPLVNATPCPQRNADPNGDNDDAVHHPVVKGTFSDHALVGCPNCAKVWHVPFGIGEDDEVKAGQATERVSRYVDPNEGQGTLPKE